jgi:hypothetical protein
LQTRIEQEVAITAIRNWGGVEMAYAIIRGKSGRRHEVDFGSSPLRVEVHAGEETVEIHIEADFDTLAENRRRFAIVSMSRQQFSEATGAAARRAAPNNLSGKRLP